MKKTILLLAAIVMASMAMRGANLEFTVNGVTFKMVKVEGGTFVMGATEEQGDDAMPGEEPAHNVTLTEPYYIGETEVTQALWQAVMGSNPSYHNGVHYSSDYGINLQRPVETVSWDDCQAFVAKLSELTGENFRLPTEAEWEFAARGGNSSHGYKYAGSNEIDSVAWYYDDAPTHTASEPGYGPQTVGTKAPNELGLYDMNGNIEELCQDWHGAYTGADQVDPTGPASGYYHVSRGGHWNSRAFLCRVSYRYFLTNYPGKNATTGLRLALTKDDEKPLMGDINLDGKVDVSDVNILVNIILGKDGAEDYGDRAYITDDDTVDVSDVNALVNMLLGKQSLLFLRHKNTRTNSLKNKSLASLFQT